MPSTAVVNKSRTIISTAASIISKAGRALSPEQIALKGLKENRLRVPRGKDRSYLIQLLQSVMWNDAFVARRKTKQVRRPRIGKYQRSSNPLRRSR